MTDDAETPPSGSPELLDADYFAPLIDERFDIHAGVDATVNAAKTQLVLEGVVVVPRRSDLSGRTPFSLTFTGPAGNHLPQGLYDLVHPTTGTIGIFLVPIGPRNDGRHRYEAVFN